MRKIYYCLGTFALLIIASGGYSQTTVDTLKIARDLSEQQNFTKAITLLETHQKNNPNDVYTAQLLANCLQWNQQYNEAENVYVASIQKFPNADFLVLDYARMKYEEGKYEVAKPLFDTYLEKNPQHVESLINLGYIAYWNGNLKQSNTHFETVLNQYPENQTALGMVQRINEITSPYVAIGFDYGSDSQPMKTAITKLETGWYQNKYFNPVLNVDYMNFSNDSGSNSVPWIRISNQSSLLKGRTKINVGLGYSSSTDNSGAVFSGFAEVNQKITPELSIAIKGESNPYFYSLASIYLPVSYNAISATAMWQDAKTFNAQAGFNQQYFMDANQLSTFYVWAVTRSFGFKKITFNAGYSYNFQTSKENSFQSILSISDIIQGGNYDNIEGVYAPYFTPNNQNIHGLIGVVNILPEEKLHFQLKGNIGIFAFADIPYLYLDSDISGNTIVSKNYYREQKITVELSANIGYQITKKFNLEASYIYTDNFFYTNNLFRINLKYRFK